MNKVNFVSNPSLALFKMYYDLDKENECIDLTVDTIPKIIFEALCNACRDEIVLKVFFFLDMTNEDINFLYAHIYSWDGIIPAKRKYKLYGDGLFERYGDIQML